MKSIAEKELRFKDETSWPVGTEVYISVPKENAMIAFLENKDGIIKKVASLHLHVWFPNDFVNYTDADLELAVCGDVCPTLTGEEVEPDGWDSAGFPSILLAAGLI